MRTQGLEVISGNAAQDRVLKAANLPQAHILLVAIPDVFEGGQIVEQARATSPGLEIIARAHSEAEAQHLMQHGASSVVMGEREIARTMLEHARERRALFEPGKAG
jgi:CPA2 family monovalent cation:H+ antiporter-2